MEEIITIKLLGILWRNLKARQRILHFILQVIRIHQRFLKRVNGIKAELGSTKLLFITRQGYLFIILCLSSLKCKFQKSRDFVLFYCCCCQHSEKCLVSNKFSNICQLLNGLVQRLSHVIGSQCSLCLRNFYDSSRQKKERKGKLTLSLIFKQHLKNHSKKSQLYKNMTSIKGMQGELTVKISYFGLIVNAVSDRCQHMFHLKI